MTDNEKGRPAGGGLLDLAPAQRTAKWRLQAALADPASASWIEPDWPEDLQAKIRRHREEQWRKDDEHAVQERERLQKAQEKALAEREARRTALAEQYAAEDRKRRLLAVKEHIRNTVPRVRARELAADPNQPPFAADEHPVDPDTLEGADLALYKSLPRDERAYFGYLKWINDHRTDGQKAGAVPATRRVDLTPYLDGTYVPLEPSIGEHRDCGHQMLYPGKWHTVVALNASGKSWFALWHVVGELRAGNTVVYAHFEETQPGGTIDRLRLMAPDLTMDDIRERLIWVDCSTMWQPGEFGAMVPADATLVILDGINAAATQHGQDPNVPQAVGVYRDLFVTPATTKGAAVLSLGHPPKARDRQGERHGFGSTAWLDVVDGVGFRMEASAKKPIRRGEDGYAMVYVVKDRYGQVEALGALDSERDAGWYKLGAFHVDSSQEDKTRAHLGLLDLSEDGQQKDKIDRLADAVLDLIGMEKHGGKFASQRDLGVTLKANKVEHSASDLAPALERLMDRGAIEWPEVGKNKSRPGWVRPVQSDSASELYDEA